MNNKGFAPILFLVIIATLIVLGYVLVNKYNKPQTPVQQQLTNQEDEIDLLDEEDDEDEDED